MSITDEIKSYSPDLDLAEQIDRHTSERERLMKEWGQALALARMAMHGTPEQKYRAGWRLTNARAAVDEFDERHAAYVVKGLAHASTLMPDLLAGAVSDIALALTSGRLQSFDDRLKALERAAAKRGGPSREFRQQRFRERGRREAAGRRRTESPHSRRAGT